MDNIFIDRDHLRFRLKRRAADDQQVRYELTFRKRTIVRTLTFNSWESLSFHFQGALTAIVGGNRVYFFTNGDAFFEFNAEYPIGEVYAIEDSIVIVTELEIIRLSDVGKMIEREMVDELVLESELQDDGLLLTFDNGQSQLFVLKWR